jgi:methionine biosynthesis protein MetW
MVDLKRGLLDSSLRRPYRWLAGRYRGLRRLWAYPRTTHVGVVDYDTYWENKAPETMGQLSDWRLRRAKVFTELLTTGDSVLDLGVGDGALLSYMLEQRQISAYGLDISPRAVEFCRARGLNVDLADLNAPVSSYLATSYDYIMMSEIIEHLPDPEALLKDLAPYARKGLVVSIPNTGFHQHRLRLLLGRFPLQWVVTPGEHLRFWTRSDFHWWAGQLGFRILREVPYEGTVGLKHLWPGLFAAAFVFVLQRDVLELNPEDSQA